VHECGGERGARVCACVCVFVCVYCASTRIPLETPQNIVCVCMRERGACVCIYCVYIAYQHKKIRRISCVCV